MGRREIPNGRSPHSARNVRGYGSPCETGLCGMITLHTYRGVCSVGASLDAAAVVDPALFAQCLSGGFAEVLDIAPSAGKPSLLT